eukprot:s863_g49.t1
MSHAQTIFANVGTLSDEEGSGDLVTPVRAPSKRPTVSTEKTVQKAGAVRLFGCSSSKEKISPVGKLGEHGLQKKDMVARTRAIVQSKCRCSRGKLKRGNCFLPFRDPSRFTLLIDHLRKLARMDKLEIDKEVWSCLQTAYNGSKLQKLTLLDIPVCQSAFKRILRLGSGRFLRLNTSVRAGDDSCPMDMRYVKKRFPDRMHSKKRQIVHDFLHHLYETLAEPMPEGTGASKQPRTVKKRDDKEMVARTNLIEKALPPGSFYEYLAMLRRAHPTMTFSYKLFCSVQVWELNFGDILKLRSDSAHVKCNICVRYKLMVRKLAKCTVARQMQLKLLDRHREQQYNDRVTYWHSRNIARNFGGCTAPATVVLICDSMDAAKYVWPRDHSLHAKEFNRFIAPKLTATAVIAHGHDLLVALSLPGLSAGSSRTVDILARTLERFRERGQDLRSTEVLIQGDNGPKEVPARVNLQAGNNSLNRAEIARYRSQHAQSVVYRAAAKLWANGLDWESAYDVAHDAYEMAQSVCQ